MNVDDAGGSASMYLPVWEANKANKQAMLVFPDDELNSSGNEEDTEGRDSLEGQ